MRTLLIIIKVIVYFLNSCLFITRHPLYRFLHQLRFKFGSVELKLMTLLYIFHYSFHESSVIRESGISCFAKRFSKVYTVTFTLL